MNKNEKQSKTLHSEFILTKTLIYEPNNFICSNIQEEPESKEYGACSFQLNKKHVKFRVGKITPTKKGLFVTLWKRVNNGPIEPYTTSDDIDFCVVNVRNIDHHGQFVFPKTILQSQGILSHNKQGGKRAFRVYPPWDNPDNTQAKKTQDWQLRYFFEIKQPTEWNIDIITRLYS